MKQKYRKLVNDTYFAALAFYRGNGQVIPSNMYRVNLVKLSDSDLLSIINSYKTACSVVSKATTKIEG